MSERLVYAVAAPAPYRNAEMDRAADVLGPDAVHVIFCQPQQPSASFALRFPARCPYHCLDSPAEMNGVSRGKLPRLLSDLAPKVVVVGGYRQSPYRAAINWCRRNGIPYCLRSDSNIWKERYRGRWRSAGRQILLRPRVRRAWRILLTGTNNRLYWQRYGMRPEQEGWWPQWIDYDHFAEARQLRIAQRDRARERFGIAADLNLLHVGRLLALKRVDMLCEVVLALDERVGLVVAGHGEQEALLRERFAPRLGSRLVLLGQVDPADLPWLYAASDVFVLGSGAQEQWAIVLNEAAASGLPIVCHRHVGAAPDFVRDGENGLALPANDAACWTAGLEGLLRRPESLVEMGRVSARIADDWRDRSDPADCLSKVLADTDQAPPGRYARAVN